MSSKFFKGILTGALVSGAVAWWWNSKPGKKTRRDVRESLEDFYDYLQPEIKKFKKMSYRKFRDFIESAADEYSKLRGLTEDKASELKKGANAFWEEAGDTEEK